MSIPEDHLHYLDCGKNEIQQQRMKHWVMETKKLERQGVHSGLARRLTRALKIDLTPDDVDYSDPLKYLMEDVIIEQTIIGWKNF